MSGTEQTSVTSWPQTEEIGKNGYGAGDVTGAQGLRIIVRNQVEAIQAVPEPPKEMHGLGDPGGETNLRCLATNGVLERLGRCEGEHPDCEAGSGCATKLWRATQLGWSLIQEELDERELLPCGHPPMRNLRDEPGYSCTNGECDARYTREQIEAVLDGQGGQP